MCSGTDARPFGSLSPSRVLRVTLGYSRWVLQPLHDRLALLVVLEPCKQPLAVLCKLSDSTLCPQSQSFPLCSVIACARALWPQYVSDASLGSARCAGTLCCGRVDRVRLCATAYPRGTSSFSLAPDELRWNCCRSDSPLRISSDEMSRSFTCHADRMGGSGRGTTVGRGMAIQPVHMGWPL